MAQFTTLRSEVKNWNLGSDDKLFKGLQQFSDNMFSKTQTTLDKFQELRYMLNSCNIEISNTFSQYQKLSERKFTEQKMAPIGEGMNNPQEDKKDTQDRINSESKQIDFFKKALSFGMDAFNIGGNDDPNDDMPDERSISQSSVSYSVTSITGGVMKNQRLPHLIGSKFFMSDKYIGLFDNDDDDEEEIIESGPQGNILNSDVYDPQVDGNAMNQSQVNGVVVNNNGVPQPPNIDLGLSSIPSAPPMNQNGIPSAPPLVFNSNGIPQAPPINLNSSSIPQPNPQNNMIPPPPPNLSIPVAPQIVVNNNAPIPPPLLFPPAPNLLISPPNPGMDQSSQNQANEGSLQDQLLRALQQKANNPSANNEGQRSQSIAKPRPMNFLDEIRMKANKKNTDEALLEQEEDNAVPPPAKMSMRDNLMRSLIGDSEPNNNGVLEDQNQQSQIKKAAPQEAVAISAMFKKSNNLFIDSDEEDKVFSRSKSSKSRVFDYGKLLNVERPKFDDDEEEEQKQSFNNNNNNNNNKNNNASIISQSNDVNKKVTFQNPQNESSQLPPPPPPLPVKQEIPKKRLEKLFESSDEDEKDPFGKALKIGSQYRKEEKIAVEKATLNRQSTANNNTKKKLFDDSDSDVDNFKSSKPAAQVAQNVPVQRQTTQGKALKIFSDGSDDEDKKPAVQQAKATNPLAPSKPKEDIQPVKINPLGARSTISKNKRGLMDSSENSNSEDDSAVKGAAAAKAKEAEERKKREAVERQDNERKKQLEDERIRLEKEEQERVAQQEQEEKLRKLKLKQEEEAKKYKEQLRIQQEEEDNNKKIAEEQRRKEEEEQRKKEQDEQQRQKEIQQQQTQPAANKPKNVRGQKRNKFGSSSENETSDDDHGSAAPPSKQPAVVLPPQIIPTTSILTQSNNEPALNPMEDALKSTDKKQSFENSNPSLNSRVSQALKDKIEAMGNLDPSKMLRGISGIPKPFKSVEQPRHQEEEEEQKQSDNTNNNNNLGNSLFISSQMDRVSIPMKKKKARTLMSFVDSSDLAIPESQNNKISILLPDDEDEKPLAVQKRQLQIKEKEVTKLPSNLPNISQLPTKKRDFVDQEFNDQPQQSFLAPPPTFTNPPPFPQQSKPKGRLDLGGSDDDDKPIMIRKSQPSKPNPTSNLLSSQNDTTTTNNNPLIKGLPNISGGASQQPKPKVLNLGGDSDDDKPLGASKPTRQVQSLMPAKTNSKPKEDNDDEDLGIKPLARNSENPLKFQGSGGLPSISSNPLSKPASNTNPLNRPSGLPNISENPLTKSSNLSQGKKNTTTKKRVMFGGSDDEDDDDKAKEDEIKISKPSLGAIKTQSNNNEEQVQPAKQKKSLFDDNDNDDNNDKADTASNPLSSKPPSRPSGNQSIGSKKKKNLFGDSDDDNENDKNDIIKPPLSRNIPQPSNNDPIAQPKQGSIKPLAPTTSKPLSTKKNLFNDSDDDDKDNAPKPPVRNTANPLGGTSKPSNPLGGRQTTGSKPKKSLFSDSD